MPSNPPGAGAPPSGYGAAMWLFLACSAPQDSAEPHDSAPPDDTGTIPTDVPLDWGVVDGCDGRPEGTFNPWYEGGEGIVVHGTTDAEEAFAAQVEEWYGDFADLTVRSSDELTEEEKSKNLFILATPGDPLLAELDGLLPARFEDDRFTFGGYRYEEPGNGVALIAPNPYDADHYVLVYAGNSFEGLYSLFTVSTGGTDYVTTRGRGTVQQSGSFCHDTWGWVGGRWDEDLRADWEEWTATLEPLAYAEGSEILVEYRFQPGSEAADAVVDLLAVRADDYHHVLDTMELTPLDAPIVSYLYPDNATKGEITGNEGNAHANDLNYEVHEVWGDGVYASTGHEDVHVIAWYRIGPAGSALLGEGLAVGMGGQWWGEPLDVWADTYDASGEIPPLRDLIDNFWANEDGITYPLAGHFTLFLLDTWGPDTVKAIYVAEDLDAAFAAELGQTVDEVEAAWRASIAG